MTSLPNLQTRLQLQPQDSPSQSITYERRQPFHPLKLYDTLSAWFVFSDAAQGSTIAGGNSHGAAVQQTRKHTTGLYVEGVVWLATRPDIAGQLVVHQNGTATLQHDKPWLAALPASAWGPEDHAAAASDMFMPGVGDRRQSLRISANTHADVDAMVQALDACLVTNPMELLASPPTDPWPPWPTLASLLTSPSARQQVQSTASPSSAAASPPSSPPAAADTIEIRAMTQGAPEVSAWLDNAHQAHIPFALLYWHTHHTPTNHPLLAALAALVHANPKHLILCALEVHAQPKNQTFGFNSRLLKFPDSHRRGARTRPVLACGHPYPAVTLHDVPELHARELCAGPTALGDVLKHLQNMLLLEHNATLTTAPEINGPRPVLRCASPAPPEQQPTTHPPPPPPPLRADDLLPNTVHQLDQGPGQLKAMLQAAQASGRVLVIVWQSTNAGDLLQDAVHTLASQLQGVAFAVADATHPRNALLAQRLGVCVFPTVHVYWGMKLHAALKTPNPQQLIACLQSVLQVKREETGERNTGSDQGTMQGDSAPTPVEKDKEFAPCTGRGSKGVRRFSNGVGHFYPKMPCLRCGCPWWLGEDWDARCARCGWDCEADGYDDDSKPKPAYVAKWKQFVQAIASGYTPPW